MTAVSDFDPRAFLRGLTPAPGVYRMLDAGGGTLYVGKAGSLKKRVASYFTKALPLRLQNMVAQIARIEISVTRTEGEALLLESQLIKSLKPRYNVLLRDDKSYPSLFVSTGPWPRIAFHRGPRSAAGRYFGPYPGVGAVRETLALLHKLFGLRGCEDTVFRNRSRPCLQYQIGRCAAPCVGLIEASEYADRVRQAVWFLEGRSDELTDELTARMEVASAALDYEQAARLRNTIADLRRVQARQYVDGERVDIDVLACVTGQGSACVALTSFRSGANLGTRTFFPRCNGADRAEEVLSAFVSQHYLEHAPPREIVSDLELEDRDLLETALGERAGHRVHLRSRVRGERAGFVQLARRNAELALAAELSSSAGQRARLDDLTALLELPAPPQRIECFDISHTQGEATVASCVVFGTDGPVRGQYRRYNIAGITPGDDYAALQSALERRFRRAAEDGVLPDLLLIDGGAGQLGRAQAVLADLGLSGIVAIGVAKGEARRPGEETLVLADGRTLRPGKASPGLHLIQQVRDEAHRFAIAGHRARRAKARRSSRLEDIPGIGPRRRASLLRHFGGLEGLKAAGVEEISRVQGVHAALAERIYAALHGLPG